jgi:broad specificity phosphatase PhoE
MAGRSNDRRTFSSKGFLPDVSFLYLIRHAQAGPRHNYDTLSEIGQQQARLLGTYLANRLTSLSAIVTGTLERHRRTAELVTREICRHGKPVAPPTVDCRWNEFILAELYQHYGPRMAKENPDYAGDSLAMERELEQDPHTTRGATGRCDAAMVRAWIENRYPDCSVQTWADFRETVQSGLAALCHFGKREQLAVFTSAGPVSVTAAAALGLTNDKILGLLAAQYNCSLSTFRITGSSLSMYSFNEIAYLTEPELRTYR